MKQSKLGSLCEAFVNILIGFGVALASQYAIFPLFGIHVPFASHLWISIFFTGVSLVRSYVIRRWFNNWLHRKLS